MRGVWKRACLRPPPCDGKPSTLGALAARSKQGMGQGVDRQRDPIWGADLAQQLRYVGLNGAFCQTEILGDLPVGATHGEQSQNLALAAAEHLAIAWLCLASSGCRNALDEVGEHSSWRPYFAAVNQANGLSELGWAGIFGDVALRACGNCAQDVFIVSALPGDDNAHRGTYSLQTGHSGIEGGSAAAGHQDDVIVQGLQYHGHCGRANSKLRLGTKKRTKSDKAQWITLQHRDTNRLLHGRSRCYRSLWCRLHREPQPSPISIT